MCDLFRAFEYFAILYDIQIDEEEYDDGPCRIIKPDTWGLFKDEGRKKSIVSKGNGENVYALNSEIFGDENIYKSKLEVHNLSKVNWSPPVGFSKAVNKINDNCDPFVLAAKRLLVARLIRGQLQKEHSAKALKLLDDLAKSLLRYIPEKLSEMPLNDGTQGEDRKSYFLRLIYLLEISSCCKGFLQIGYADECLNLIEEGFREEGKPLSERNKTPYELVALYNKALGYHHIRNFAQAEIEFMKICEENETIYWDDKLLYPWREDDKKLFNVYIYDQSLLMLADTLIKSQRSKDARECGLNNNTFNEYKNERKVVLEARIENDLKEFEDVQILEESVDEVQKGQLGIRSNLLSQHKSTWFFCINCG